jgi:hypothetical protein
MITKKTKEQYKAEGKARMIKRKQERFKKYVNNIRNKDKSGCRGCGEDPYCYCGDGIPYSY